MKRGGFSKAHPLDEPDSIKETERIPKNDQPYLPLHKKPHPQPFQPDFNE